MEATFEDCWTEFKRRSPPRYNEIANLLQEEYSENLQHVTSMLDIGAGHGDLDVLLIKDLLPHLTQCYAVECDQDQCRALKDNIARIEGRNIEIDIFNGFMEEYHGPSKSVGLIIMAGVAYYIPDKKRMVKQVMDWLKTGGQFIMTHIPPNTPITKGQDPIRAICPGKIDASVDGASLLTEMGIKHREHRINFPIDVTLDGLDKVLRILLHRVPSEEETEEFSAAMEPHTETKNGRSYISQPWSIVVGSKD